MLVSEAFDLTEAPPERIQELWCEIHDRVRVSGSPECAEDVVQEAFLAALRHPPREKISMRGWLTVVARNISIRGLKRDRNREQREREAALARRDRMDTANDHSTEIASVSRALERLPEPYRGVLCLRYLEGVSIEEIALRSGRTPSTVRSQIMRGLDRMRQMLPGPKRRSGTRGLLFLPVLSDWAARLRRSPGLHAAACAAGVVVLVVLLRDGVAARHAVTAGTPAVVASAPGPADSLGVPPGIPSTRQEITQWSHLERWSEEPAGEWAFAFEGRVVDATGRPLAGVPVLAASRGEELGRVLTHSDDVGHYRIAGIDGREWVWADDGTRAPSSKHMIATVDPDRGLTLSLGAEPGTRVFLIDADGLPLAGADVRILGEKDFSRGAQIDAQGTFELAPPARELRTGPDGSFLMGLIRKQATLLLVRAAGQASCLRRVRFDEVPASFEIRLPRPATLSGILLDEGRPVADATLRLGLGPSMPALEVRTDTNGAFRFELVPPGPNELVLTGEPRSDLASLSASSLLAAGERREARLQLSTDCTLRGVVTSNGCPAENHVVQLERLNGGMVQDVRSRRTDARGAYAFPSCSRDSSYAVRVLGRDGRVVDSFRCDGLGKQVPELRGDGALGFARLSGRIESREAGDRAIFAEIWNPSVGNQWLSRVDAETGEFTFQDVLPNDYILRAWTRRGGAFELETLRGLRPRENRRLDPFLLGESGTLFVQIRRPGIAVSEIGVAVSVPSIDSSTPRTRRWLERAGDDEFKVSLPPGEYDYWVFTDDRVRELRKAVVEPGGTTIDLVDVPEAIDVQFDLRAPRELGSSVQFKLRVQADRIHVLQLARAPGSWELHGLLPVGASRIDVTTSAGLRGVWTASDRPVCAGDILRIDLEEAEKR